MQENEEIISSFLVWLKGAHSPATVLSYNYALNSLKKYLVENRLVLKTCTLDDLTRYLQWMENKGLKSGTRNLYVTALKTLWQWLYRQKMVDFADDLIPSPPAVDKTSYPFLEPQEFRSLMDGCGELLPSEIRNKAIISFLYATGLRLGELLSLNVADLNMDERKALVCTFKRKNHKREVYWDEETHGYLKRWLDVRLQMLVRAGLGCEALWISLDTAKKPCRVTKGAIERMIRELREKVGMEKKITPHSFRHGFGYRGVRAHANLRYLQVMMGHAKLSTTQTYMGYKDKEVEEEYRRVMETGKLHDLGKTGNIVDYAEQQTGTTREKGEELGDSQQVLKRLYFEGLGQTLRSGFHYHQTSGVPIRQKAKFKDRP
jgi:integrase/recombinase XerD